MSTSGNGDVIEWASGHLTDRLSSLKSDVDKCLAQDQHYAPAPFPALLYCFSVMDLLGALHAGNATRNAPTSKQTQEYVTKFMRYNSGQACLLFQQFRHNLVHLAQPMPRIAHGEMTVGWYCCGASDPNHLKVVIGSEINLPSASSSLPPADQWYFVVSVSDLVDDIRRSVVESGGYLESLGADGELQKNARAARAAIENPGNYKNRTGDRGKGNR